MYLNLIFLTKLNNVIFSKILSLGGFFRDLNYFFPYFQFMGWQKKKLFLKILLIKSTILSFKDNKNWFLDRKIMFSREEIVVNFSIYE